MQNRNLTALRAMLAANRGVNVSPGILNENPDNIPQINAPTLSNRLSNQGYQSFADSESPSLRDRLMQFPGLIPEETKAPHPQAPRQQEPSYGAQGQPGLLGQGAQLPSPVPEMPDPVAARQAAAAQGAAPAELGAPSMPQQADSGAVPFYQKPEFQQALSAFGGAFSDVGARPGVSFGSALEKHLAEAKKGTAEDQQRQGLANLRKKIANNPNMGPMQMARLVAQFDPLKGAQMMIAAQTAMNKQDQLQSTWGKAKHDADIVGDMYGIDSPQHKKAVANADRIAEGSNGLEMTFDDSGRMTGFKQGGGVGSKSPITSTGLIADTSTGSSRGGGGRTYIDPATGEKRSTLTPANITQDQKVIIASQNVQPLIDELAKNLPQFQSGWKRLKKDIEGKSNEWMATNFELPTQFQAGQAALKTAPESLLKAFGLNTTDEAMATMRAAIEPGDGESSSRYKKRLMGELKKIYDRQARSAKRLSSGIPLNQGQGSGFVEGKTYVDGQGRKAIYRNNQFVEVNDAV